MKKFLIISAMLIGLMALGALTATPVSADTPTPTMTPAPGLYSCLTGLAGQGTAIVGSPTADMDNGHVGYWYSYTADSQYFEWLPPASPANWTVRFYLDHQSWVHNTYIHIDIGRSSGTYVFADVYNVDGDVVAHAVDIGSTGGDTAIIYLGDGWNKLDHIDFSGATGGAFWLNGVAVIDGYCEPATTPTPTPGATPTAFLLAQSLCITATAPTTATLQATPTPYGLTTTPLAVSPTPGPTATPQPVSANLNYTNTANFATGLQPWTAGPDWAADVGLHTIYRGDLNGPDGAPGVAQIGMPNNYDTYSGWPGSDGWMGIHDPIINYTGMQTEMLIFPLPQLIDRPINITGQVRTLNPVGHSGNHIWLMFWYLDPGKSPDVGQTWILKPAYLTEVSYTWGTFAQRIYPDEDLVGDRAHQAAALALTWYITADDAIERGADSLSNAVLVDDVKISIGDLADQALPRCAGPGYFGPNRPSKTCAVAPPTVDVLSRCHTPTDVIDIGGWINWVWCRVSAYFTWVDANRQQVLTMQASQNDVEPFGSTIELVNLAWVISGQLDSLQAQNHNNAVAPYNFANMMDLSALGKPLDLHVVTSTSYDYLTQCPVELLAQSSDAIKGACMSVYFLRTTPAVQIVQWFLNGSFVITLIYVLLGILHKLGGH